MAGFDPIRGDDMQRNRPAAVEPRMHFRTIPTKNLSRERPSPSTLDIESISHISAVVHSPILFAHRGTTVNGSLRWLLHGFNKPMAHSNSHARDARYCTWKLVSTLSTIAT